MNKPQPVLLSVNIGQPAEIPVTSGAPFTSSIGRRPVEGPVRLTPDGLEGDACENPNHHGEHMRVNAFCKEAYDHLGQTVGTALTIPSFGENLTFEGYTEEQALIGDVLRIGTALLQVSQPREPCSKVPRFLGIPEILKLMVSEMKTGFYLRVLEPGTMERGQACEILERGHPDWSIHRLNIAMYRQLEDKDQVKSLQNLEPLSPRWKASLLKQHIQRYGEV